MNELLDDIDPDAEALAEFDASQKPPKRKRGRPKHKPAEVLREPKANHQAWRPEVKSAVSYCGRVMGDYHDDDAEPCQFCAQMSERFAS